MGGVGLGWIGLGWGEGEGGEGEGVKGRGRGKEPQHRLTTLWIMFVTRGPLTHFSVALSTPSSTWLMATEQKKEVKKKVHGVSITR